MPAQSVDPRIDEWRQQPVVEGDAHGDPGEERQDELRPAHRAAAELTARTYPVGGAGSRCGSDQRAVIPPSARAGGAAEYAVAAEDHFVSKPANLTFEQAAAVGVSATTALQLLRDQGKVTAGQKVLINGASGGVGTFAVQIAKAFGAEVTGVCSTDKVDLVHSIGADYVIDYTKEDFTRGQARFDFILDNVGNHPMSATRQALTPSGKLQPNGGGHSQDMGSVIAEFVASLFVRQQLPPSVKFQNRPDLIALKDLVEAGKVTPVIDATYPLSATATAIAHVAQGHARGTVVITM